MKQGIYRGVFYTLMLSGMFEYYSFTEQRFIKADYVEAIEHAIDIDLEHLEEWE